MVVSRLQTVGQFLGVTGLGDGIGGEVEMGSLLLVMVGRYWWTEDQQGIVIKYEGGMGLWLDE
jgi:hypothetical protein